MNNNLHRRRVSEQVKGGGGVVVPDYWDAGKYRRVWPSNIDSLNTCLAFRTCRAKD
jgi:hypothetical protein